MNRLAGLRVRLTAAFVAVALLASVLASGLSYVLLRRAMLERAQDRVLSDFRGTLSQTVPLRLPPDAIGGLGHDIRWAMKEAGFRAVVLSIPRHGRIPVPEPAALEVPVSQTFAASAAHGVVFRRFVKDGVPFMLVGTAVWARPPLPGDTEDWRTAGPVVFATTDLAEEDADLWAFTEVIIIADAAALVVALLLALVAARGVLVPVRRLGDAARRLGAGELDTRIPVRGRDELAGLARTFNETAAELERTVGELRAMEASARQFVADVSHELRTPLTSMVALTEGLAERTDGAETRLIVEETRRLGGLVEDLIEISRFDAGVAVLVPDDLVVADAVRSTLEVRGWSDSVGVDGPQDLAVRLDPRRFDVILANLVGNAFRHGAPPVAIDFARAERDGRPGVLLTVRDAGPGIPDELRTAVFGRFVKADAARSRGDGSGLGLSIARENARLHGGELEASESPEGGAALHLWLPLEPAGPEEASR